MQTLELQAKAQAQANERLDLVIDRLVALLRLAELNSASAVDNYRKALRWYVHHKLAARRIRRRAQLFSDHHFVAAEMPPNYETNISLMKYWQQRKNELKAALGL